MAIAVEIDKQSCQSSERCLAAAPEAFGLDDDHLGDVLPGAAALPLERLRTIAAACPALAIRLLDDHGREVDF